MEPVLEDTRQQIRIRNRLNFLIIALESEKEELQTYQGESVGIVVDLLHWTWNSKDSLVVIGMQSVQSSREETDDSGDILIAITAVRSGLQLGGAQCRVGDVELELVLRQGGRQLRLDSTDRDICSRGGGGGNGGHRRLDGGEGRKNVGLGVLLVCRNGPSFTHARGFIHRETGGPQWGCD